MSLSCKKWKFALLDKQTSKQGWCESESERRLLRPRAGSCFVAISGLLPTINHDLGESVTASKTKTKPWRTITSTMPTITNDQLWPWWKYPCLYSPPEKMFFSFFLRNSLTGSDLPPPFMFCQTKTSTAIASSSSYLGMCFRLCAFFGGNIYILAFQKDWFSLNSLLWLLCILKTVNQCVSTKNCLNKWISCVFVIDVYQVFDRGDYLFLHSVER